MFNLGQINCSINSCTKVYVDASKFKCTISYMHVWLTMPETASLVYIIARTYDPCFFAEVLGRVALCSSSFRGNLTLGLIPRMVQDYWLEQTVTCTTSTNPSPKLQRWSSHFARLNKHPQPPSPKCLVPRKMGSEKNSNSVGMVVACPNCVKNACQRYMFFSLLRKRNKLCVLMHR